MAQGEAPGRGGGKAGIRGGEGGVCVCVFKVRSAYVTNVVRIIKVTFPCVCVYTSVCVCACVRRACGRVSVSDVHSLSHTGYREREREGERESEREKVCEHTEGDNKHLFVLAHDVGL